MQKFRRFLSEYLLFSKKNRNFAAQSVAKKFVNLKARRNYGHLYQ